MAKIISIAILLSFFTSNIHAAPKSDLWEIWDKSNERSETRVSHTQWGSFLQKYASVVEPSNATRLIKYSSVTAGDRRELTSYIEMLSDLEPRSLARDEQFAYWVNLYNALTVDLVLDNYPLKSITKLGGFFSFGPWDQEIITISGEDLTLNDIEHRILRPIWRDERIHYAVNCASIGCPNVFAKPFNASQLEEQLDLAAREFINSSKGLEFRGDKLVLSEIYNWYAVDFGDEESFKQHLLKYLEGSKADQLKTFSGRIDFQYNWGLNE